jgi:hypothetical protein
METARRYFQRFRAPVSGARESGSTAETLTGKAPTKTAGAQSDDYWAERLADRAFRAVDEQQAAKKERWLLLAAATVPAQETWQRCHVCHHEMGACNRKHATFLTLFCSSKCAMRTSAAPV